MQIVLGTGSPQDIAEPLSKEFIPQLQKLVCILASSVGQMNDEGVWAMKK